MKCNQTAIARGIRALAFLMAMAMLFATFTYLFRDTGETSRQSILQYQNEPEDSLDVVFVGASNVVCYWDPLQAFHEEGIASRSYAVTGMPADTYLAAVKEALKKQNPKVLVVEARLFGRSAAEGVAADGARKMLDNMDLNLDRLQAVTYYAQSRALPFEEAASMYVDLIYYHNNYEALTNRLNWQLADNSVAGDGLETTAHFKGFQLQKKYAAFEDPSENLVEGSRPVPEKSLRLYTDILTYCQKEGIELLITATPVVITQQETQLFNALAETAQAYNVPFLNANHYYEEIGFDFSQDFLNAHHTNVLGAEKYTAFMADYLKTHYDLPDRRQDKAYDAWHKEYDRYFKVAQKARQTLTDTIRSDREALEKQDDIAAATDAAAWLSLCDQTGYTLLMASSEKPAYAPSAASLKALKQVGVTEALLASDHLMVVYSGKATFADSEKIAHSGKTATSKVPYSLSVKDDAVIMINGEDQFMTYPGGICMVAINNQTGEPFDWVSITVNEDGSLALKHC